MSFFSRSNDQQQRIDALAQQMTPQTAQQLQQQAYQQQLQQMNQKQYHQLNLQQISNLQFGMAPSFPQTTRIEPKHPENYRSVSHPTEVVTIYLRAENASKTIKGVPEDIHWEIIDMEDFCSDKDCVYSHEIGRWKENQNYYEVKFYFRNADDAVLFKLRWK